MVLPVPGMEDSCAVVCCGYRHILSPKTSLTFPAWLVRLPSQDQDGVYRYWWRSKRDFVRLSRALSREPSQMNKITVSRIQPPKASLQKLAENASWTRPLLPAHCPRLPHNFTSSSENKYHVSMKKSLHQVDCYLNAIHNAIKKKDPSSSPLASQWKEFCRMNDVAELAAECAEPNHELVPSLQESSRLGQYFCTRENAKQLVELVLDWIDSQEPALQQNVTFLEPSCGHGQVVWTLVKELQSRGGCTSFTIIACDIDGHAIHHCCRLDVQQEVDWRQGDFLESTCGFAKDVESLPTVICLGGPPYTTGAGSKDMQRDLPERFVSHCFDEWRAQFVAFFLPRRYQGHDWDYRCRTHELVSPTFYFQGKAVPQPSILQSFQQNKLDGPHAR